MAKIAVKFNTLKDRFRHLTRETVFLVLALLLLIMLIWAVFGPQGLLHLYRMHGEKQRLLEQTANLRRDRDALLQEIDALKNDWRYLEALARREEGMVAPGEILYRFAEEPEAAEGGETARPSAPEHPPLSGRPGK